MARRHYRPDPYWTRARWVSMCHGCGAQIPRGSDIYYFPLQKRVYCSTCGRPMYRQLLAEKSLDRHGTDIMYDQ